ncbi:Putative type II secretion system protein F [Planctomycetes bacterium Pla163]|uniref:Type II secretion system protein F n=1 Tax=Rohdeia mirabilis TaxID=2528008 RepID=A0A518D0M7_9BACT|nr:Putative type II secretion system protein F [Planctomycetes bacterium Pla163]
MPPEVAGATSALPRLFEYRARRVDGSEAEGRASALDPLDLDRQLARDGLTLISAKPSRLADAARGLTLSQRDLVAFSSQLATMIQAGLPLLTSLQHLAAHTRSKNCRLIVASVLRQIEGGSSLAEALGNHPAAFPSTYVTMVRSGELSAGLPDVLRRQGDYLEWVREVKGMTKQALIYPTALSIAICGLVVILITFLIPRLIGLFPGGPEDLPEQTRQVMALSDFLVGNWIEIATGLALAGVTFWFLLGVTNVRLFLSRMLLRVPRIGSLLNMISIARFSTTAAALHQSGCEILRTLEIAGGSCGNAYLEHCFVRVSKEVRGGRSISESMAEIPDLDPFLVQLTSVGETSGRLGECLEQVATSYNAEVPRVVKWALGLIEPAVIIGGGLIVGYLLLAALLPVFKIYETL